MNDVQAYWTIFVLPRMKLQDLIEAVVVHETWFFRDREAFATMVRMLRQEVATVQPAR